MKPGKIQVLSREEVETIHSESLHVLSKVGVKVENENALKVLKEAGCEVDFAKRLVKIPEHVVKEALKKAIPMDKLYYRDGKSYIDLTRGETHYFVSLLGYHADWRAYKSKPRAISSQELLDVIKVNDYLPNVSGVTSTVTFLSDVPKTVEDVWSVYLHLKYFRKAQRINVVTRTPDGRTSVVDVVKLAAKVLGGVEAVTKTPPFMFVVCPSPPLRFSEHVAQIVLDAAAYKVPVHLTPMVISSVAGPATLAGTVLVQNSENLAAITLAEFTNPGTPVTFGTAPQTFDARTGNSLLASPESYLIAIAMKDMARFYGFSSTAWIGNSDSKIFDEQAAIEISMGALLAELAGVDIAIVMGLENMILVDLAGIALFDDIAGMAKRIGRGISVTPETLAIDVIMELGPGATFLTHKHTRKWIYSEHYATRLLDRHTRAMWEGKGSLDAVERARVFIEKVVKEYSPEPLPPDIQKELESAMREIAEKRGISWNSLPRV
jgi:trimethylamine--corrinoid protein Co-methyltransferase